ncbi:hypothetical protein HZF08_04270 [Paenibacillus sp. CGMCC 1.16610]|uniref:Uncharacterized protein n=1 Tax=Paenibacillus anseongense TaxID=2682845 RepID=A0ABW9UAS5_9BACL|nr:MULTISPECIES: hypothetical protein [Paenibacillus]MBA2937508.1 hypothetical protein [Paenibacillus sp. CGMCC 1.16610]MVQ36566.1 hypothetical protein [Paenibacillus anseongense]
MLESLIRTAFVDDCLNIMNASEDICEVFKEVSTTHRTFAQFGSLTRSDDQIATELLARYRDDWESHRTVKEEVGFRSAPLVPKTEAESSLALALGWIAHRTARAHLTPESAEAGLYQDAELFRKRYVGGSGISREELTELFSVMQQRFFIEMHTFVPDVDDIEGWFDRLDEMMREWEGHMAQLASAVVAPDSEKGQRNVDTLKIYDEEDALIRMAETIRSGVRPSQGEIEAALSAEPRSKYARGLNQAINSLRRANAFFIGSSDLRSFNEFLAV